MKKYLIATAILLVGHWSSAKVAEKSLNNNTEKALNRCYQQYPFFLEAIGLISDKDYSNAEKSQGRLIKIQQLVKRSNTEDVRKCLDIIFLASKSGDDRSSYNYIKNRMSEIEGVVNAPLNAVIGD